MSAKDESMVDVKMVSIHQDQLPTPPNWAPKHPASADLSINHEGHLHHSASFKAVLKHNEDLMARLTVSLRRVSHLEKHVEDLKQRLNAERIAADGLRDEVLISVEKERLMDADLERHSIQLKHRDKSIEELKTKLSYAESQIEELRKFKTEQSQEMVHSHSEAVNKIISEYELKISNLELHMSSLEKYRHKTQTEFKPQFKRLKLLCEKQMDKIAQLGLVNQNLTARLKMNQVVHNKALGALKDNRLELREELRQLKSRLLQALKKANKAEKENESLKIQNQELQTQAQGIKSQVEQLEAQVGTYESLRQELSQKLKQHETEISSKNKQISELSKVIENLKAQDSNAETTHATLDAVLKSMQNLYFTEEPEPPKASSIVRTKETDSEISQNP